jgi:hypothetical protein
MFSRIRDFTTTFPRSVRGATVDERLLVDTLQIYRIITKETRYPPVTVNHLSRNVARVGRSQEHDAGGDLHRLLEEEESRSRSVTSGGLFHNQHALTPGLPMVVVTPKDSMDSLPMVATTKGVRMGPGHYGQRRVSLVFRYLRDLSANLRQH